MNGEVSILAGDRTIQSQQIAQLPNEGAVIDALLFNLLDFMKQLVSAPTDHIQFIFNGYNADDFKYNTMLHDAMQMITNYDDPENATHVDILNNFWRAQDF